MPSRYETAKKAIERARDSVGKASLPFHLIRVSEEDDVTPPVSENELKEWIVEANPDAYEPVFILHQMIAAWDSRNTLSWNEGTLPGSIERRKKIYDRLQLSDDLKRFIDDMWPIAANQNAILIERESLKNKEGFGLTSHFYWDAYSRYLRENRKWNPDNIGKLDSATSEVVGHLKNPFSTDPGPVKGLVVGYVQSGKTANFTGVIAKAIDAGYRLIIVLAGIHNALRNQTQRRLDKELVGQEILSIGQGEGTHNCEYIGDPDWADFNSHGGLPSKAHNAPDIYRLTTGVADFKHRRVDLTRFRFEKKDTLQPFCSAANLAGHHVKLVVIKKNKTPLGQLIAALNASAEAGVSWEEVPSLIVDDESDQASLHTGSVPPEKLEERKTINQLLVTLLGILKRPSYIGYTATPFANVFVSPDDADDLFPSDFIVSLPRPDGYMGVADFYDEEEVDYENFNYEEESGDRRLMADPATNFGAHIRTVIGEDALAENLQCAIDSFILSGATKLFRESKTGKKFRHHTMLIHIETSKDSHITLRDQINEWFAASGYGTLVTAVHTRLQELWNKDFQKVCAAQQERNAGWPSPGSYDELRNFIAEAVQRVVKDDGPAIALNSDKEANQVDFDKTAVWKIIVGGAKLSRGYTVEGLTITYYRRIAGAADTLMQMGRWFGYREGYRDLVRLFIGIKEQKSSSETVDLYQAFWAICQDEEEFRSQLKRYSALEGEQRLKPKDIPPLVPSHLLQPSAKNKMFNALRVFTNLGGELKQSTFAPLKDGGRQENERLMRRLLGSCPPLEFGNMSGKPLWESERTGKPAAEFDFNAVVGIADPEKMLNFLRDFSKVEGNESAKGSYFPLIVEFLEGNKGDICIDRWLIIAPQMKKELAGEGGSWVGENGNSFHVRIRNRDENKSRYKVFTESPHVNAALALCKNKSAASCSEFFEKFEGKRQGIMLFYPVQSDQEKEHKLVPSMGFALIFPQNKIELVVQYSVIDKTKTDDAVVDCQ